MQHHEQQSGLGRGGGAVSRGVPVLSRGVPVPASGVKRRGHAPGQVLEALVRKAQPRVRVGSRIRVVERVLPSLLR